MGSVGSNPSSGSVSALVNKPVTVLDKYTGSGGNENIRKDFNLGSATESQIDSIRALFKGMMEYDRGHSAEHIPYTITDISIRRVSEPNPEELARNKELFGRTFENKDISIYITTEPTTDNAYLKMMDQKTRMVLLGKGGGFYKFNKKYNKTSIRMFDVAYGTRTVGI